MAAVAARLGVLDREDRHLVELVELPFEPARPAPSLLLCLWGVPGRPEGGGPVAAAMARRAAEAAVGVRRLASDHEVQAGMRQVDDAVADPPLQRRPRRDELLQRRFLEALAFGRHVAGRAAVHARDPHEVDVVVVLGKLHLLHPQRRVDHVEDRGVAQFEERVLLQTFRLLPGELVVRGQFFDVRRDLVAARGDAVDLGLRAGFLLLQRRQPQVRGLEIPGELVEALLDAGRGPGLVRQRVLVAVALGVEGSLQELGLLIRPVDLRVQGLQTGVPLRESPAVRGGFLPRGGEIGAQARALFAVGLLARRARRLQRLVAVEPQEGPLHGLPVAVVVGDHHPDEDGRQHGGRPEEDAVQPRDVVVVIDRLGRRLAWHLASR